MPYHSISESPKPSTLILGMAPIPGGDYFERETIETIRLERLLPPYWRKYSSLEQGWQGNPKLILDISDQPDLVLVYEGYTILRMIHLAAF